MTNNPSKPKTILPKIKYPMDMTVAEHEELGRAASKRGKNKKQLIYDALKEAYGIDLESANDT